MAQVPNCPKCNKPLPLTKVKSDLKSLNGKMVTCIDADKVCYESKSGKSQHIECKNLPLNEHYIPYSIRI